MASTKRIKPVKDIIIDIRKCEICRKLFHDLPSYTAHMKLHTDNCPYACDLCPYKCKVKKYLSRHKKSAHTEVDGGPECPVCGKVFRFNNNLRDHLRVHTGEKPYSCEVCNKSFSSTYCLTMHRYIHTDEKPFECKFCPYACRDSSTLRRHEERHMGIYKTFTCPKCKKNFKSKRRLQMHIDEEHLGLDTRRFSCEICNKKFKTVTVKNQHFASVHEKANRIKCDICDRLISKQNMNIHLTSHVDIRPFKCSFQKCGKCFKNRGSLQRHSIIHYPDRQYQCDLCDSKFARRHRLKKHRLRHSSEGYTCDYCGGTFSSKTILQFHIKSKHGRKAERFICDECGSVNFSKRSIIVHIRYGHGGRNERNCRICGDDLLNSSLLTEHYLKVHKLKFVIMKQQEEEIRIKNEIEEVELRENFEFHYDIQKMEVEEHLPHPEDPNKSITYTRNVLEVDLSRVVNTDVYENMFDDFYRRIANKNKNEGDYLSECADAETAYSEKVLEEDMSRINSEIEKRKPEKVFDDFFKGQIFHRYKNKGDTGIVIKSKQHNLQKAIGRMLSASRTRKVAEILDKARHDYNRRIQMAYRSKQKKEPTQIKYFKRSEHLDNSKSDEVILEYEDQNQSGDDLPQDDKETSHERDVSNELNSSLSKDTASSISQTEINRSNILENSLEDIGDVHISSLKNDEPCLKPNKINESQFLSNIQSSERNKEISQNIEAETPNILDTLNNYAYKDTPLALEEAEINESHISKQIQSNSECNNETSQYLDIGDEFNDLSHKEDSSAVLNQVESNKDRIVEDSAFNKDKSQKLYVDEEMNSSQKWENSPSELEPKEINETSEKYFDDEFNSSPQKEDSLLAHKQMETDKDNIINEMQSRKYSRHGRGERNRRPARKYGDDEHGRVERNRRPARKYGDDETVAEEKTKNAKLRFDGHECYICFKIFKTKNDLKLHCREHFDICNEKMLKKCPFCGYVTDLQITKHIEMAHNINMRYSYGQIIEKEKPNGSKYVYEIDEACELEIIPSISNLNKRACMKIDEKNRKNNNLFMGKTKLVKKNSEWVVEKEAVKIDSNSILPEFTDDDYAKIKEVGDEYADRLKQLNILAKNRGVKMYFPCEGCEKICQTLAALRLHNRKHEENPKRFKPKIWINRHIDYTTKKRKKHRSSKITNKNINNIKNKEKSNRNLPVKTTTKHRKIVKKVGLENRYAPPQPVKNNHKCDKKLIEFYNTNIRGKDIEFWQFLKIFNKMNRENVNDFDDLINRDDVHFGLHTKDERVAPVTNITEPVTNRKETKLKQNKQANKGMRSDNRKVTDNNRNAPVPVVEIDVNKLKSGTLKPVIPKKNNLDPINKKNKPRVIMISKRENMRRNEIKNQMRQKLAQMAPTA